MHIQTLSQDSADFPAELHRLEDPPAFLRVRGVLPPRDRMVAIVGTREASTRALEFAHTLASSLVAKECVIVSGGALGIDAAAHEGALTAGGKTVVVQGPGLAKLYPKENLELFDRVRAAGGCELSEHEDEVAPMKHVFLARNRIIAALSRVVVVIEAPFPSGALSTAHTALKLGIPLLVVPAFPTDIHAEGSNLLLRLGARVCLGEDDVLSALEGGEAPQALPSRILLRPRKTPRAKELRQAPKQASLPLDLPSTLACVLDALADSALDLDSLAARTGLAFDVLQTRVTELEMLGAVSLDAGGRVFASARSR